MNADTIARGLSEFNPEGAAIEAGRLMLNRLSTLAEQRESFAFETTLSTRTFVPRLKKMRQAGYQLHLYYVWLPDPETCVRRVAKRVADGGHYVPGDVVRRRYLRGMRNFLTLYSPLAEGWTLLDNSPRTFPHLAVEGSRIHGVAVFDEELWVKFRGMALTER